MMGMECPNPCHKSQINNHTKKHHNSFAAKRHHQSTINTTLFPSIASQVLKQRRGKTKIITQFKHHQLFKPKRTQATTNANLHR